MRKLCERLQTADEHRRRALRERDICHFLIGLLCGTILAVTVQVFLFLGSVIF